jgi:ATP-dependent Clp protease protease subunit
MHVGNYFLQGEVSHSGLPQWLAEHIGLYGNTPEAAKLIIWVNSNGGDVLAAVEAINLMRSSQIPIITIINGCAESAALLIAAAGHTRFIFDRSWGMAHHFATGIEGNYHELMDSLAHHKLLHEVMVDAFIDSSLLTREQIEIDLLGRQNTWLSAQELLDMGIVDDILKRGEDVRERILAHASSLKKIETPKRTGRKSHKRSD